MPADLTAHIVRWQQSGQPVRTAADEMADRLRDLIHCGDLSPGDRLPAERQLCEMLGVGRVTMREALAALRAQGYLTVRRGQHGGTFISTLALPYRDWRLKMQGSPGLLDEIVEYRVAVETQIARLAAARRTHGDLRDLTTAVESIDGCTDATVFRQADAAFHAALAGAAGNTRLTRAMIEGRSEMFVPANIQMVTLKGIRDNFLQHLAILKAVRGSDPAAAAAAMQEHLEQSLRDLLEALGNPSAGPDSPNSPSA
jgi:GntR family transcriptional repressor for pyruvate dehydrogenase complex